jgi:DNA polymerase IIIc chi subunit
MNGVSNDQRNERKFIEISQEQKEEAKIQLQKVKKTEKQEKVVILGDANNTIITFTLKQFTRVFKNIKKEEKIIAKCRRKFKIR